MPRSTNNMVTNVRNKEGFGWLNYIFPHFHPPAAEIPPLLAGIQYEGVPEIPTTPPPPLPPHYHFWYDNIDYFP